MYISEKMNNLFKYKVNIKLLYFVLFFMFFNHSIYSQEKKLDINGYISNVSKETFFNDLNGKSISLFDNIIHNRLNLAYYLNDNITFRLQLRNQFVAGESFNIIPQYSKLFETDNGYLNLNHNLWVGNKNLMNLQVDRFYFEYMGNNWEISLGRQRINWGRSIVWNPNDIFNSFSYYDIDYPERPGSDALRMRYYYGTASQAELVMKIGRNNHLTIAGLTKFNKWDYDFQFILGYVNSEDYIFGTGWEGNIGDIAFRGECSYYIPKHDFKLFNGSILSTISLDYSINSRWIVQAEFLYNDKDYLLPINNGAFSLYSAPTSSKQLSFSEYNFFGNISYLFNPIISFGLSSIYYTDYSGYFIMPNINISLSNNLSLNVVVQYFNLEFIDNRYDQTNASLNLKWNF